MPELLGGRVKTLHPRVHAGILARRDEADDIATLEEHGIEAFDLVCVNLYPFEEVTARRGVTEEEAVETIDVGGPSMLRGAAKNFAHCAPVCRPDQYHEVLEELRAKGGELSLDTRRRLAAEAFAHTAAYEAAIATWFNAREEFPDSLVVSLDKVLDLAYGENPHQRAAYYAEHGVRRHLLSRVEQLHGKELSFNNLNDFSAARSLAREFALPACVIVKHANPCGVAVGTTAEEAYDKALASDPTSAYGGCRRLQRVRCSSASPRRPKTSWPERAPSAKQNAPTSSSRTTYPAWTPGSTSRRTPSRLSDPRAPSRCRSRPKPMWRPRFSIGSKR